MCSGQDTPLLQVGLSEPAEGPTASTGGQPCVHPEPSQPAQLPKALNTKLTFPAASFSQLSKPGAAAPELPSALRSTSAGSVPRWPGRRGQGCVEGFLSLISILKAQLIPGECQQDTDRESLLLL